MLERADSSRVSWDAARRWFTRRRRPPGSIQTVGYDEEDWDEVCMGGIVQMLKKLD